MCAYTVNFWCAYTWVDVHVHLYAAHQKVQQYGTAKVEQ